jgi:hypothetical protein
MVGDTILEPFTVVAEKFESFTLVAFVEDHSSKVLSPDDIVVGVTVNVIVGAEGISGFTVTVVVVVLSPPGPEIVMLYVVVTAGDTVFEPFTVAAEKFESFTLMAFVDVHSSVVFAPAVMMVVGVAVNDTVGAAAINGVTVTVLLVVLSPPGPVTVKV